VSARRSVSGDITRWPASSPPRRKISKKRESSSALVTVFAAGTSAVRKRGSLPTSITSSSGAPSARVSRFESGGSSRGPVM
jgi:hypothetical protein